MKKDLEQIGENILGNTLNEDLHMTRIMTLIIATLFAVVFIHDVVYADGAAIYNAKCKMCHGADGKGNAVMKVPPVDTSKSAVDLKKVVEEGKGKMPPYKGKLQDTEIEQVVSHMKGLK